MKFKKFKFLKKKKKVYPIQQGDSLSLGFVLERTPPFKNRQIDVARDATVLQNERNLGFGEYV